MNEPGFLVRVALGIGLAKRTVPAERMQAVNDATAQAATKRLQPAGAPPSSSSQAPRVAQSPYAPQTQHGAQGSQPASRHQAGAQVRSEQSPDTRSPAVPSAARSAQPLPDGSPMRGKVTDIGTVMPAAAQLTGDLEIEESIVLQCVVRGNVTQTGEHQVVLSSTGGIHGMLRAHTAVIGGTVEGDVFADRVVLLETGIVHGNIEYVTLAIKEGATINGTLIRVVPNVITADENVPADTLRADMSGLRAVASAAEALERVA